MTETNTDETVFMSVRVKRSELERFREYCQNTLERHNQSDVIRELMTALVESRLKIEPTKAYKELYK